MPWKFRDATSLKYFDMPFSTRVKFFTWGMSFSFVELIYAHLTDEIFGRREFGCVLRIGNDFLELAVSFYFQTHFTNRHTAMYANFSFL